MPRSLSTDRIRNFKFHVLLNRVGTYPDSTPRSLARLGFAAVDGLGINIQNIEYREGGMNVTSRKLPGQATFGPITLSRGVTFGPTQTWKWILEMFAAIQGTGTGNPQTWGDAGFRCDAQILVMDHPVTAGPYAGSYSANDNNIYASQGYPYVLQYRIYNCWPSGMLFSNLDAGGNQIFMEQMVLQHEGFDIDFAPASGQYLQPTLNVASA